MTEENDEHTGLGNDPDDPTPMSDLRPEDLLPYEEDILEAAIAGAEDKSDHTEVIEIRRRGKFVVALRLRSLDETENDQFDKKATRYKRVKGSMVPIPIERDEAYYRSLLIYNATVASCKPVGKDEEGATLFKDEDPIWKNESLRKRFGVEENAALVDKILLPGEKQAVVTKINEISGFETEEEMGATLKN